MPLTAVEVLLTIADQANVIRQLGNALAASRQRIADLEALVPPKPSPPEVNRDLPEGGTAGTMSADGQTQEHE